MSRFDFDPRLERLIEKEEKRAAAARPSRLAKVLRVVVGDGSTPWRELRRMLQEARAGIAKLVIRRVVTPVRRDTDPPPLRDREAESIELRAAARPVHQARLNVADPFGVQSMSLLALHQRGRERIPLNERLAIEAELHRREVASRGHRVLTPEQHDAQTRDYFAERGSDWVH
jgi:hypothetical protein